MLKHLNYNYGLRNQYMPDMAGLRVSTKYIIRTFNICILLSCISSLNIIESLGTENVIA